MENDNIKTEEVSESPAESQEMTKNMEFEKISTDNNNQTTMPMKLENVSIEIATGHATDSAGTVETKQELETGQPMSKSQKKKLLKLKGFEERKKTMRKKEKEMKKLKRVLAKEQGLEHFRAGPSRKELKLNKIAKNPADIIVAIDLSFDELMIEKDLSSCVSQLLRVYTSNRRANRPIPLHFTGLKEDGKLHEMMDKHEGWKNWDVLPHKESFMEIFDKSKIIYLTSESETVLDVLEKGAVYIIGGLVDHNHHKCLTHDIALKNSIRTARLPLSEHLIMKTRTVLTINQCFDIILGVSEGKSWKEILLNALPQRKNIVAKDDVESAVETLQDKQET